MPDRPAAPELLDIVAETLREAVVPALDGPAAYQARIAASLVALVARELRLGDCGDKRDRLRELLGDGDILSLTRTLAGRLRDGSLTLDDPAVASHLRTTTLAKLAIDNPKYARFQQLTDTP